MFPSMQELLIFILIIILLNFTGVLPIVIKALREFRGDYSDRENEKPKNKNTTVSPQNIEISYRLLGVSPSSPWDEIESAYRKKAKLHHPDLGGDEDTMKALNEAYEILKKIYKKK
ncbi:MAG TPA: J domain-containing protein [Candidatus Hydrogenedens sp.]|nr:J domain-containing protein [Candidatus Hydrogenedens sp.]HOK08199.1 J domain-containing protein [Candidatus Hydrogenedens sp.]HOL20118.1 J domain-containing protein [Candidatus Hydrogenedens sp.]HPP58668.1 J domain-containing protein [Candidatus Hydrogenedens sp.]